MKLYRITFMRTTEQTVTIPAELVKSMEDYDGLTIKGAGDEVLLTIPRGSKPICMLLEQPDVKPAADHLTDEDLRAAEPVEA